MGSVYTIIVPLQYRQVSLCVKMEYPYYSALIFINILAVMGTKFSPCSYISMHTFIKDVN